MALFENEFLLEEPGAYSAIRLGDVQGVSEVTVNGKNLGVRWYGPHTYDISDSLVKGQNSLSIKLTTISGNYLKSLKNNQTAQRWTGRQPYYPVGIMGPVELF